MPDLPTPDFSFDPKVPGACIAGVRPFRHGSYRLDAESDAGKFIVHNYGHGGCGITLSWGCADKVRGIVRDHLVGSPAAEVAVLGAGVMGLTAATLLLDLGLRVTIYSDRKPDETTSHKAGGQWAVSVMEFAGKEAELSEIVAFAYKRFTADIGASFGVSQRPNYTASRSHNLEVVLQLVPGLIPEPVALPRLPFQGHSKPGFRYETLLIEPPIFLKKLETDLLARGVVFETRKFRDRAQVVASCPQEIIINCTGLGAMTLWNDPKMVPIKGQLAMLPAQPGLDYLYGQDGYMFPRADHLVIGGTFESGVNNETPSMKDCAALVDHIKSLFGLGIVKPLPDKHIHNVRNAPFVNPTLGN